jgi:hypothetical protein
MLSHPLSDLLQCLINILQIVYHMKSILQLYLVANIFIGSTVIEESPFYMVCLKKEAESSHSSAAPASPIDLSLLFIFCSWYLTPVHVHGT